MARILVIGDVMLDRYWYGDVTRLSQEAPVPVVAMTSEECRAGAAANVGMNCASLGADVTVMGFAGNDDNKAILEAILEAHGVAHRLFSSDDIRTTTKLRIIGKKQQIVRVDFDQEQNYNLRFDLLQSITSKTHADYDILILSDYNKGVLGGDVCRMIINGASMAGQRVIVDPKGHDYRRYHGANLVKPNLDEIKEMTGGWSNDEELSGRIGKIRAEEKIGVVLLTRAADGMTLYSDVTHHIPAQAHEVYDVTGAGDTVMAALAVELANGKTLLEAATIANVAAGIVVQKFGTATVSRAELDEVLNGTT